MRILGYFNSLVQHFGYFYPKNRTNEKKIAQNSHKANRNNKIE